LITYGLVSNITRRKWVEDALWQSEERTRMIIDTALDAVITMDTKGVITDWNAQAAAIFGWSRQEAVGQSLSTIIIPFQHREAYQRGLKHFLATGESPILNRHIEINALYRDGHEFPVELSISPLRLGDIVIFTAFVRDITERKRAEAELAQAHEQVLEASRFKSELLANVSHDLRTPLTAIMGYSDMLQAGVFGLLSDKQQAVATRIRINTEQLLLFINNLLDQAQIESGKLELRVSSFVPFGLIEAIESTMSILAQAKGLELSSDIAPEVPAILSGDFQRLKAILMNLVSNAIKFTNQGSVQIRIYQPDTDHWALQVSDTGRGIPLTAQTYIFDAFRQVDGAVTRQKAGSGLGLSIVKRLTNAMGGQISLVSEPDQGSTFTILLPLIPVEESGA
jgi:PAS domain S-box-containing protein